MRKTVPKNNTSSLLRLVGAIETSLNLQSLGRECRDERMAELESDFGVRWTSGFLSDTITSFCVSNPALSRK